MAGGRCRGGSRKTIAGSILGEADALAQQGDFKAVKSPKVSRNGAALKLGGWEEIDMDGLLR
jgi:hypothetical protein